MKRIFSKLKYITVAALALSLSSCDAILDDSVTDFGATPVLVQFATDAETANFIQTDANPVYTYEIPVTLIGGRNQPIDQPVDVTVAVDPSSTAVEGVEFNLVTSQTTIPAGEMTANVVIEVLSENLDPFDPQTVVLDITSSDLTISEDSTTEIVLQAACEYDLSGFIGSYNVTQSGMFGAGTYVAEVSEGPEPNTLLVENLRSPGSQTIIELSTDPTNPTITFRSEELGAALYVHSSYGDTWATTITPGDSSYGSCDNALNLEFKLCVSVGCFAGTSVHEMVKITE